MMPVDEVQRYRDRLVYAVASKKRELEQLEYKLEATNYILAGDK